MKTKTRPKPPTPSKYPEMKLGDRVSIVRTNHSYFDGSVEGIALDAHRVLGDDGIEYFIPKNRDVRILHRKKR